MRLGSTKALTALNTVELTYGTYVALTTNITIGRLSGSLMSYVTNRMSGPVTLTITAPTGTTNTFEGNLYGTGPLNLTLAGPGRQVLTGSNTCTGVTTVNAGTLVLNSWAVVSPYTAARLIVYRGACTISGF